MKSIYSKIVLVALLLAIAASPVSAREYVGKKTNTKSTALRSKAAACKRAQSTAELNIKRPDLDALDNAFHKSRIIIVADERQRQVHVLSRRLSSAHAISPHSILDIYECIFDIIIQVYRYEQPHYST